ncbi:MAG TPA: bifunctional DNA-formamidopyrimidine glycosylase/DNA-(apurinic or apyrimidinic site) lyase [Gemmatimonadaceae bacterium]|nr:bifunctional DNA-formamidopyrimidine glycosylase/DNA-(apurinic or apyrimidinic site) lyase [Gemmatimonadaceae bacterium]
MPELPEVETMARALHRSVRGRTVSDVVVHKRDVLRGATPARLRRELVGHRIDRVWRRAKLAVIDFDSGAKVAVQPRFTGSFVVERSGRGADQYCTLHLVLDDGRRLHYRDVRRLGTFSFFAPGEFEDYASRLGPEPLRPEFTGEVLYGILRGSIRPVKARIMDQYKLAGVGNIYASEALWRARIDPSRESRSITRRQAQALRDGIVSVLRESIELRGTTIRDYENGAFAERLDAYDRAGEPCSRCGTGIVMTHGIDGRATYFCPRCQR